MATSFFDPEYLEQVYAALFDKLKAATFPNGVTLAKSARLLEAPDDVPPGSQPAMFLVPGPLHTEEKNFALGRWTFTAIVLVYLRADSAIPPNVLPQTVGFNVTWGIVQALYSDTEGPYQKQTLGGLVYHCWVEGEVTVSTASEQVVIAIPVYIMAGDVG
jgi:hypothetical protein